MSLDAALSAVTEYAKPGDFSRLTKALDAAWIEEALVATGTASVRKRRLPADQVLWLVVGMGLFRNRSITNIVDTLDLAWGEQGPVAPSAITQARTRLGADPLEWLWGKTARTWGLQSAQRHAWRGLMLLGIDGSKVRAPDSKENRARFGGHTGGNGESSYPLVRVVALMVLGSHLLLDVRIGPYATGEVTQAREMIVDLPDDSLTIVDRGFFDAVTLLGISRHGNRREWLTRAKSNTNCRVIKTLGPGDELVEMNVSDEARALFADLPKTWLVRRLSYQPFGTEGGFLLTSLLDDKAYPADEIRDLYHERWELELGFDEIKTNVLEREEALRSQTPTLVEQELLAVLLVYNLVRLEMEKIADEAKVPPTRISFVASLRFIRDEFMWLGLPRAAPGTFPRHLRRLRENLKRFILPERRAERRYPRKVKISRGHYGQKHRPSTKKPLN